MKKANFQVLVAFPALFFAAGGGLQATPYSDFIQSQGTGPVVYYTFDESAGATTAASVGSASAFDAPAVGTPTFGVASFHSNMGTAVDLGVQNVNAGAFDLPNGPTAANFGTYLNADNVSLSFWVKTSTTSQGGGSGWNQKTLLGDDNGGCCGGGGSDSWWGVLEAANDVGKGTGDPNELVIGANTGNNPINVTSDTVINDGEWHHVVLARGASTPANHVSVYIDGQFENNTLFGTPNNTYNVIGGTEDSSGGGILGDQHFDAMIDELAIFDFELSAEQVAAQFDAATAAVPEPTSVAIWSLIGLGLGGFGYYRARRRK